MVRRLRSLRDAFDAVLLDLDGTLLDREGTLTPRTRRAVHDLVAAGFEVLLCTGRSVLGSVAVHEELALQTPLAAFNGAWIGTPGGEPWRCKPIPDDLVAAIGEAESRAPFFFRHLQDGKYGFSRQHVHFERVSTWYRDVVHVEAEHEMPDRDVMRVSCYYDGDEHHETAWLSIAHEARRRLHRESFPLGIFPLFADTDLVLCELQGPGRGKAEVFAWLRQVRGIEAERTIAIGDQRNDISMLEEAGLAISMANGVAEVRERADLVIGRHDEDGIAAWIEDGAPHPRRRAGGRPGALGERAR